MSKIEEFKKMIDENKNILFFTGAGVSTLSGIPDFRSADGMYNDTKYKKSPEEMLSRSYFNSNTEDFYKFYKNAFDLRKYEPNIVHKKMAELEEQGKVMGIITQNVDGLHTKAGSKNVIEYHGTIFRNHCMNETAKCPKDFDADYVFDSNGIPRCKECGAIVKPHVTLYEEMPYDDLKATNMVSNCDVLVVCGTSLSVYPAANFVHYLDKRKQKLVIVNRDETRYDYLADLCVYDDLGKVFGII